MRNIFLVLIAALAMSWAASADVILDDPATLHTGPGAGTTCATGGCPIFGSEVNGFTGHTIDIFQQSSGATALKNPWLLVLGVANSTNPTLFSNSSITSVTAINTYPGGATTPGSATFGGAAAYGWNGQGYVGSMTLGDVYHQTFFSPSGRGIDASNSFANWQAADLAKTGITVSSFGIYVFAINGTLSGNGLVNIDFGAGVIPKGTFVVAYGNDGTHVYVNPFTEAGLETATTVTPIPEPASLALLGSGMLAMGGIFRKRLKS